MNEEELDRAAEHGEAYQREVELAREAREVMLRHSELYGPEGMRRELELTREAREAMRRHPEVFGEAGTAMRLQIQQLGQFFRDNNPVLLQLQEVAEIIRDQNPVPLQLEQLGEIIRDYNPLTLRISQLAQVIRNMPTLLGQVEPMVQAAERFARSGSWPLPPFEQRLLSVVDVALREGTPPGPVAHQRTASLTVTPVITATATVTASGSAAMRPMRVSGQGTVENPPSGQAEQSIGQILALALVAIATWKLLVLPEQDWAAVDHRLTVIGFGLTIAVLIWNKQNKPK